MQLKGKPPETQYATRPGARGKRREVALDRPGFEPGRIARMAEFKAIPRPSDFHGTTALYGMSQHAVVRIVVT
jgi:hypothetical protein